MKTALTLFAAVAATVPAPASAADLLYALSPVGGSGYSARWRMALNPIPTQSVVDEGFAIERVSGTFPRTTAGDAYLDFFFATNGGGMVISDADGTRVLATLFGPQLYTGSEAAPTMARGTFALTSTQSGGRRYTLTVVDAPSPVPEPATWALIIGGFGTIGIALRRRRCYTVRYT